MAVEAAPDAMNDLNWDASQLHALAREGPGPVLVRGRAGSGRTAVAIGHALHLLRQPTITGRRILFVTPFHAAARVAAAEIAARAGDAARQVTVTSCSDLCVSLLAMAGCRVEIAPEDVRAGFLSDAIAVVRHRAPRAVLGRSLGFFSDEIAEVIKGRALGRRDEYLALEREGRWRGLEQSVRQTVWGVFEEYQARLDAAGMQDPDGLPLLALDGGAVEAAEGFDEVIADDAHGLSRAALLFLNRLASPSDRMFVLLDEDQRYHRQGFSLKEAGIDARRSVELTGAWRPPAPIRAFAEAILHGETLADAERAAAMPGTEHVAMLEAPAYASQFSLAAERVSRDLADGVRAGAMAVLAPFARDLFAARRALASQIPAAAAEQISLLTIDEARGLEFDAVVVVGVNEGSLPAGEAGHDLTGQFRDRRRLYVAATRARCRLAIVFQSGLRSAFLPP